jgi:hypothetical protein
MEIYCNQLGMVVKFSYCLSMNDSLPCRSITGCWEGRTDILKVLKEGFTEEELKRALGGLPKTRLQRIIESVDSIK